MEPRPKPSFELDCIQPRQTNEPACVVPVTTDAVTRRSLLGGGVALSAGWALAAAQTGKGPVKKAASATTSVSPPGEPPQLRAHPGRITSLAFLPDGSALITACESEDPKVWTMPSGTLKSKLQTVAALGHIVRVSPDGKRLVALLSIGKNRVGLVDYSSGALLKTATTEGSCEDLAVSPTGERIAAAMGPFGAVTWSAELSGAAKVRFSPYRIVFSPDGRILLGWDSFSGNDLDLQDVGATGSRSVPVGSTVMGACFDPAGKSIAALTENGTIGWFEVDSGDLSQSVRAFGHMWGEGTLAFAPGGERLVAVALREIVDVSARDRTFRRQPIPLTVPVLMQFSPDGTYFAVGTSGGNVALFDWPTLRLRTWLFDPSATPRNRPAISYRLVDKTKGIALTYTQPCGAALPAGAVCTCNCVPGAAPPIIPPAAKKTSAGGGTLTQPCTATPVPPGYACTCNCVPGRY